MEMYYEVKQSGERIHRLRMKNGFTQESIAETLNIDRSFYSRIESGKKGASVDLLIQLSALFNVSLDYLILGKYIVSQAENTDVVQLKADIAELAAHLNRFRENL